ncbi:MAG: hypothetical protein FWG66_03100 [Spirochaetes bacterium]|nr:hypothetical protein [Spirochaetota bacterium]
MVSNKRILLLAVFLTFFGFWGFGQTNLERGEELLMMNLPHEALPYLEEAVLEDPMNGRAFLYLGIALEQLDLFEYAIAAYRRAIPRAGNLAAYAASNLGNIFFRIQNTVEAERFYSLAIEHDSSFSAAFLGRANTRLMAGDFENALHDYEEYLWLEPRSAQRPNVEELIGLIRVQIAEDAQTAAQMAVSAQIEEMLIENIPASVIPETDFILDADFIDEDLLDGDFPAADLLDADFPYADDLLDAGFTGAALEEDAEFYEEAQGGAEGALEQLIEEGGEPGTE